MVPGSQGTARQPLSSGFPRAPPHHEPATAARSSGGAAPPGPGRHPDSRGHCRARRRLVPQKPAQAPGKLSYHSKTGLVGSTQKIKISENHMKNDQFWFLQRREQVLRGFPPLKAEMDVRSGHLQGTAEVPSGWGRKIGMIGFCAPL